MDSTADLIFLPHTLPISKDNRGSPTIGIIILRINWNFSEPRSFFRRSCCCFDCLNLVLPYPDQEVENSVIVLQVLDPKSATFVKQSEFGRCPGIQDLSSGCPGIQDLSSGFAAV